VDFSLVVVGDLAVPTENPGLGTSLEVGRQLVVRYGRPALAGNRLIRTVSEVFESIFVLVDLLMTFIFRSSMSCSYVRAPELLLL